MKRVLLVLVPFILFGCTKNYVMSSGETITYTTKDFFDCKVVAQDSSGVTIVCDENTGILYYTRDTFYTFGITPIIDEDGNPLTLDRWKRKQVEKWEKYK